MKNPVILNLKGLLRNNAGFAMVETLVAVAIGGVALGGAMMVNSQQLRLVKTTRDSNATSHSMQERVEQLRSATWRQITNPTYLSGTYFAGLPKSISPLGGFTERVTVQAWPDASVCPKLVVEKTPNRQARIVSTGTGIAMQRLAKVDVEISWQGQDGRSRTRELTTVISNGGISRMNLPAMGPLGGGTWDSATTSTTQTTTDGAAAATGSGTTTTTTPATTTTTTTTPPATTTTTSGNNGNGRGTVGGKAGKN